ncbi:MAG: translocation/assembly module TamB domain-containing protein [Paenirhodobacter sp.]|uniref:translocation/assembly module TamB domain-containing protein n=1 Tax=Paenirhodobacter sp. TaxID=1965326 RepID=UPI003D0BDC43
MRRLAILLLALWPSLAPAQDSTDTAQTARDRSYLTGLIEDNLSGAGRSVVLDGFAGALSSRATFDQLTIADENGVWITIRKGALAWSRSAILAGKIEIQELSAEEIDLARLPGSSADGTPAPEATPFALPDLPVSVDIGKLKANRLAIGAPVFGQAVTLSLDGTMTLADGAGKAQLAVNRIDGPKGQVSFTGQYSNRTRELALDLLLDEGKDGIAATLMGLPGRPALTLSAAGTGPIDEFTADVALSTEGQPRLTGQVTLKGKTEQSFAAKMQGDVTPLLPPEYHAFFGTQVSFAAEGSRAKTGVLSLTQLTLDSDAVDLAGQIDLLPSGLPARFDLTAKLGLASGEEVLLPLSGAKTWLRSGDLALAYDSAQSDGWKLDGTLDGLRREDAGLENLTLSGSGRIGVADDKPTAGGTIALSASGIAMSDPGLGAAIGPTVQGRTLFSWQADKPLRLSNLALTARDFDLLAQIGIDDLAGGIDISGNGKVTHRALASLSQLAGRPLSGSVAGDLSGSYTVLSGAFDASADLTGQDVTIGQAEVDALLAGSSQIALSAKRDETGLTLRNFSANAQNLSAEASGLIATGKTDVTAKARFTDLATLGRGYRGALSADAHLTDDATGAYLIDLTAKGTNLALNQPQIDPILAGNADVALKGALRDSGFALSALSVQTPQLTAKATGDSSDKLDVALRLANAALLAPGFNGPVTVKGTVAQAAQRYALDLSGEGPGGTSAKLTGTLADDFATADLKITGRAEAALANAFIAPRSVTGPLSFDIAVKGKPGLEALSGKITTRGARFVAPTLNQTLENISLDATLAGSRMQIATEAAIKGGGTLSVNGPVTLSAPCPADLKITLKDARQRDPELYDTRISGQIALTGPMTGGGRISGALTLDKTELRVPSSGLGGAAAIPEIDHVGESAAERQTRQRAGLIETKSEESSSGSAGALGLDLTVSAPREIFVRGRGLDAELGGTLRLTGTTANIVPIGQFNLIRGRLDILGKRFTLTDGQVAMQGALTPWILFEATTTQDDTAITLAIEGQASAPELKISSSPELPEEEVLAHLLFNKGLSNLSALQAAQLASAVASLAGKGGDGIVSKLRKSFGLDDLDVGTDASGNATVRAGKYLSENIYSDVAVNGDGSTEINLNLDVTKSLTARGSVDSTGSSSLGLFFEKDY